MLKSTDVIKNDDGTYTVVGGNLNDGDKGIYVVAKKTRKRTGEKIGESLTIYSFFNARFGKKYDFKRLDEKGNPLSKEDARYDDRNYHHRGMYWNTKKDGTKIYASARDFGNYGHRKHEEIIRLCEQRGWWR